MLIGSKLNASSTLASNLWLLFLLLLASSFLFFFCGAKPIEQVVNIGAIIDANSRIGKEEKTAMEIALLDYNNGSKYYNLSLHFRDHQNHPLQAAQAAQNLIREKEVKAVVGMERWEEAALVADIGSKAHIPILSFSAPAVTPPLLTRRWPFLVRMTGNSAEQMRCIAELTRAYNWRSVIAVYEDHIYSNGDSGELSLLFEALQGVGSEILDRLLLPPFELLSDPDQVVKDELAKLQKLKSRVFVVLYSSLPMMIHLFREAREIGLMGKDTVWILTDSVTNYLDSVDTSVLYSMEGALGIKIDHSYSSRANKRFYSQFRRAFRNEYPEEDNFEPGIYALKAYDSIATIIKALKKTSGTNTSNPNNLLSNILLSNFNGLTGYIRFKEGELKVGSKLRIVNVVGNKYKEVDFWLPRYVFSRNGKAGFGMGLEGPVNWPGDLNRMPKGWVMPSNAKPLIIGVPVDSPYEKFIKVVNLNKNMYEGFCIDLFYRVLDVLGYNLPFRLEHYNGTYDDLVNRVHNKTLDAAVGDITIIAERYDKVEFTHPYAESGLSMIVPVKSDKSVWMFMKPFTWQMWAATVAILVYMMFIVWFLEHQTNPEFRGPLKNQIGTAVMFTFSSLFFAHRERVYSNLTRMVLVVWLFLVLILNKGYTASLTSMLTIQRLQHNVTDIDWLRRNNLPVGCDGVSFVRHYLENVLKFKPENIKSISRVDDYHIEFQNNNIYAAFLELPFEKVFLNHYCKKYFATKTTHRFGGFGFVFQKGSPIAADISKAILKLSEDGELIELEKKWSIETSECSSDATTETESLSLKSFWHLYVLSGATSTFCFILFLIQLLKKYWHFQKEEQGNTTPGDGSVWNKTIHLARYIYHGQDGIPGRSPTVSPSPDERIPDNHVVSSPAQIEVVNISDTPRDFSRC